MIYLVTFLSAFATGIMVLAIATVVSPEGRTLKKQLAALRIPMPGHIRVSQRRVRHKKRMRIQLMMEAVGARMAVGKKAKEGMKRWLLQAGFRSVESVAIFMSIRMVLSLALGMLALSALTMFGAEPTLWILVTALAVLIGWMVPFVFVKRRARQRQKEIQKAIPDMVDLLIVCVEAGLGLNQALFRVAQEIDSVCTALAEELAISNLEIRAGTPRHDALRGLGERTGLEDLRSLVSMLVQTDKFGTSIGKSLRVHSETLRTKRRQYAEENAAKTGIKMLFPLALFIFPAIAVVILGPAFFHFRELFGTF